MSKKIEAKIIADSLSPHMKILNDGMYLLLIDEEVEIKEGDLKICLNDNYISKYLSKQNIESDTKCSDCKKIIAYYPLTKESKELESLPLLPNPFESEYNANQIIEMLLNVCKASYPLFEDWIEYREAMKYQNKSQSKQFSLEDIKKALNKGEELNRYFGSHKEEERIKFIQSLSTQQLPKEFIPEYEYYYHSSKEFYKDAKFERCSKEQYDSIKEEIPTCPVKVELKTITNSEGKQELVGTYKY